MNKIQQITQDALQKQTIVLDDGTSFDLTIEFVEQQYGWFIKELVYSDFTLQGHRICVSPNMLHQFKNQIQFGIACLSEDNAEPMIIDSFSSETCSLYLLTEDECAELTEYFTNG